MKTAVLYARVSSKMQEDGASLESQIDACRAHAESRGLTVARAVTEVYSGAYLFDRPLLNGIREEIRANLYDALIVYDVDRLSRNLPHLGTLLEECERFNTELIFVNGDFENSAEGMLLFSIRGYLAQAERIKIIERTTRGRLAKAKNGTLSYKRPLFGYRIGENGKREIYEPEADAVRLMFEMYLGGKSTRSVAAELNRLGIATPNNSAWWASTVYGMLKNPAYSGTTIVFRETRKTKYKNGERVVSKVYTEGDKHVLLPEGTTPAIITPDEFERAQKILSESKQLKRNLPKREFLLRGLMKCATCGRSMSPQISYKYRAYVCASKQNQTLNCHTKMCAANKAEAMVWERVEEIVKNKRSINRHIKFIQTNPVSPSQARRKSVEIESTRLRKEIQTLIGRAATVDEDIWREFKKQIEIKKETLAELESELHKIDSETVEVNFQEIEAENLRDILIRASKEIDNFSFEEKTDLLDDLRISIIWNGQDLTMFCADQTLY